MYGVMLPAQLLVKYADGYQIVLYRGEHSYRVYLDHGCVFESHSGAAAYDEFTRWVNVCTARQCERDAAMARFNGRSF